MVVVGRHCSSTNASSQLEVLPELVRSGIQGTRDDPNQTIHLSFAAGALLQGDVVCLNGCFGVVLRASSAKLTTQLEVR